MQETEQGRAAFKARAKELAHEALERLGEIAMGAEFAPQHAIPAAKALIEFGYGRAAQEKGDESGAGLGMLDELLGRMGDDGKEQD